MGKQTNMFEQFEEAKKRMERRFAVGAQQEQMLVDIVAKTVIVDRLVPPKMMSFYIDPEKKDLRIKYESSMVGLTLHRHALNQLCSKVSLPMAYTNFLLAGVDYKRDLAAYNLEALYMGGDWLEKSGQSMRFLHRIVGTELRGFLSRRFNRHLASAPLLRAFVDECAAVGAKPIEALTSPVRNALKCLLPKVFEVCPGEYICLGIEWSNSDFGSGKAKVLQTVWRINTGTAAVLDEGLARAHIGSVIEESDIEMSDETAQKEVAAQQSAVRDHVREYLSESTVQRLLAGLKKAFEEAIPWPQLRSRLRDIVGKENVDWMDSILEGKTDSIIDLPPITFGANGERMPNRYWVASAVSAIAAKAEDPDRQLDLQREAGKLLAAVLEKP
jgi:hypothetical protein